MKPAFNSVANEVDNRIGFKYRTVYLISEDSRLHYHDYYEIFLVLAPSITHLINEKQIELPRGTLIFIRKDDVHTFKQTNSKIPSLINLAFTEEILTELFFYLSKGYPAETLLTQVEPPSIQLEESDIIWMYSQLEKMNSTVSGNITQLEYYCRIFLFKIFTRYFSQIIPDSYIDKGIPEWLYRLDIEMHKLKNFSKDSQHMIHLSGKSHEHLSRMMKKHYGKTISEYINDLRLNYWANVLTNSDKPILDICFECGFQNVGWAYSLFKKKYGMSPLKYRKTSL